MYSNNRLDTIIKYKLLIIIGLFVAAALNGARQPDQARQEKPVYVENTPSGNSGSTLHSAIYNENCPVNFLELEDNK